MWTIEKIEKAVTLWNADKNGPDIAQALGVAVKCIYDLAARRRDLFPPRTRGGLRKSSKKVKTSPVAALIDSAEKTVKLRYPPKAFGEPGIPAAMLVTGCCNFPLWGDHEAFDDAKSLYCGGAVAGKGPYCEVHAELAAGEGTRSERAAIHDAKSYARRELNPRRTVTA